MLAQAGDQPGEVQAGLPEDLEVPAAPVLSPDEALASFRVRTGLRVELVASEPLVVDPVVATFDGEGRLWVCEMRGYMPNVDGEGERTPNGVIAVLEDTDGDGRMDRRTSFLDELVLPRAVFPCEDGALVIVPPRLLFARDTDGDGRADEIETIADGMGGIHSPEHAQNGIVYTHRNWYRLANASFEFRRVEGDWIQRRTAGGGQWGLAQDDFGRMFFDTNPDPLRGDLFPSHYAVRNPNHGRAAGVNTRFAHDLELFPIRMNPGVNRGYHAGLLREDFTLSKFTAACSPLIYRGARLPQEFRGDAFVCEPAGNLIKRFDFQSDGLALRAEPVDAGGEFFASSDERFRPVHMMNGPDGGLYVVDMYRGIIQHRVFVTSFLRKQILQRGLDKPVGLGRIWRVVPEVIGDEAQLSYAPLSGFSWSDLVAQLGSPNGWKRDVAQRTIVEEGRGDRDAIELLREAVREASAAQGRRHALWALGGIGALDRETALASLGDAEELVRIAGVQLCEAFLHDEEILEHVFLLGLSAAPRSRMRHQVLLSLGEGRGAARDIAMIELLTRHADSTEERQAALSGLQGNEIAILEDLLGQQYWRIEYPGRAQFLKLLSRAVVNERKADRLETLFDISTRARAWQAAALIEGVAAACPRTPQGEPGPLVLVQEPKAYRRMEMRSDLSVLASRLVWPGKPGYIEQEPIRPLLAAEQRLFERGQVLYTETCVQCHQSSGRGEPGKAPTLRQTRFVLGDPERLMKILMHGLVGPMQVGGQNWDAEMPAFVAKDEDLAAVATFLRREWGHGVDPVTPELVRKVREDNRGRIQPWRSEELGD